MNYKLLTAILTINVVFFTNAQSSKKGGQKYDDLHYAKSIKELTKAANSKNASNDVLEKLANAYYFTNNMPEASTWYGKLVEQDSLPNSEVYYRYSMSLKTTLEYEESKKWMQKFAEENPQDSRAIMFKNNPDFLEEINSLSGNYELENMDFNSKVADFGTSFYKDGIVFASSRGDGRLYKWNEQPFLDLYYKEDGSEEVSALSSSINTKFHESSTTFSKDGTVIYFTRNNYFNGMRKGNKERINGLKIYRANLVDGVWKNITPMPFCSDDYNVAHPALSPDGKKLYFSSDMPSTIGKSDIYVVDVYGSGDNVTYGEPQNLGERVNTSGKENFPYVSDNGILYFSSNGRPGLGGMDVFKMDIKNSSMPVNVGKPVNSSHDDFEFIIDEDKEVGYFTSNRKGGLGDDDIYKVKVVRCELDVSGVLIDENTKEVIVDAEVTIYDNQDNEIQSFTSDDNGMFTYKVDCLESTTYKIKAEKDNYTIYEDVFTVKSRTSTPINLELELDTLEPFNPEGAIAGPDLFNLLDMNPIYFDFNKSEIRLDAQVELEKVIDYMKAYPLVKIDVRSHTDARGKASYNLKLSKNRNKATKKWIISRGGISSDRITGDGYGETQITNTCTNGVRCKDVLHEKNRRSEFIVIAQ